MAAFLGFDMRGAPILGWICVVTIVGFVVGFTFTVTSMFVKDIRQYRRDRRNGLY